MSAADSRLKTDENLQDLINRRAFKIVELLESQLPDSKLKLGPYVHNALKGKTVLSDRLKSGGAAKSINDFYELLQAAIKDKENRENIPEKNRILFTEEYPPEQDRSEAITVRLMSRSPGTISQGKHMNRGVQNFRPRLRETLPDPEHPNKKLLVYGTLYDNMVELCCWARTNKAANRRAIWLENLIDDYTWFFKWRGISQIRYDQRLADRFDDEADNLKHCRPMRYFVSTERITTVSEQTLADIAVKLVLTDSLT